jgi:hypothetical protein
MRHLVAVILFVTVGSTACGPRPVQIQTGQQPTTEVTLRVTNNLSQAVNVYVVTGGQDIFLKQVDANGALSISVPGVSAGTIVTVKATSVDGSRTYTRENVTLSGVYEWQVP